MGDFRLSQSPWLLVEGWCPWLVGAWLVPLVKYTMWHLGKSFFYPTQCPRGGSVQLQPDPQGGLTLRLLFPNGSQATQIMFSPL